MPFFHWLIFILFNCVDIAHRDIKPCNIIIQDDFEGLKFIDFGLAKQINNDTDILRTDVGTCRYKAPELLLKKFDQINGYTQKVDVW